MVGALRSDTVLSEFFTAHCRAPEKGDSGTAWGCSQVSASRAVVGMRSVTLCPGLYLTYYYVQFDSDNAFGEKRELFSYFSPHYLDLFPRIRRGLFSSLVPSVLVT